MASAMQVVITNAGLAEIVNAEHSGTAPVVLTQIGVGTGQYTATADRTSLQNEVKRISTLKGGTIGDAIIHLTANDDSTDAYSVYEIGVYTDKGTLLAVYSQNTPIVQKVSASEIMIALDIVITNVNPDYIAVGDTTFVLSPATQEKAGVVELATADETVDGVAADVAVTPSSLSARTATTTRTGLVELATDTEVLEGKNNGVAITPKSLASAFVSQDNESGFQKLPSGIIVQWGKALIANGDAGTRITFPQAFPSNLRSFVCTTASGSVAVSYFVASSDSAGATVRHNGNGGASTYWVAVGK